MTHDIGLDVSQKITAICVVDSSGRRLWRGQCPTDPEQIRRTPREPLEIVSRWVQIVGDSRLERPGSSGQAYPIAGRELAPMLPP